VHPRDPLVDPGDDAVQQPVDDLGGRQVDADQVPPNSATSANSTSIQ
jgi:hypothetical protein